MAGRKHVINREILAQRLREARGDMSIKEMAGKLGIGCKTYRRYESADGPLPSTTTMVRMVVLSGKTMDYLLGLTDI